MTDEQFLSLSNMALALMVGIGAVIESIDEPHRALAVQKLINWQNTDADGQQGLADLIDIMIPDDYAREA